MVGLFELHDGVVHLHEEQEFAEFVGLEVWGLRVAGEVAVEDLLLEDDLLEVEVGGEHPERDGLHQLLGFARHRTENIGDFLAEVLQFLQIFDGFEFFVEFHPLSAVGHVDLREEQFHVAVEECFVDEGKVLDVCFLSFGGTGVIIVVVVFED